MRNRALRFVCVEMAFLACLFGAMLGACTNSSTPLTPAQVQANLANATYYLQAVGCLTATAAAVATPVISISGDAQGNQVLSAVGASGQKACTLTVPPSALPVPAVANAPAVSAAVPPS